MAGQSRLSSRRAQAWLAASALLLAAVGGGVVWLRQAPTAVTLDDAVAQFRDEPAPSSPSASAPAGNAAPGPAGEQATATPAPAATAVVEVEPSAAPVPGPAPAPGSGSGPGHGPEPEPGSRLPDEGVYAFRTEGGGQTDALGGARHDYPAEVPVVVRRGGCGYTVRWQPLNERWDEWEFCPDGTQRAMARISTYHEFFKRGQRQDFDCGRTPMFPPERQAGHQWSWSCRSPDSAVEATTTVIGVETLDIGGAPVQAVHYRHDARFTGANEGSQVFDWWLHLETGLPIHLTRDLKVRAQSPFGPVNYTERYTSTALSMTPRR